MNHILPNQPVLRTDRIKIGTVLAINIIYYPTYKQIICSFQLGPCKQGAIDHDTVLDLQSISVSSEAAVSKISSVRGKVCLTKYSGGIRSEIKTLKYNSLQLGV